VSLLPSFRGEPAKPRLLFFEHEGNRAVRDGAWKLVALHGKPWELYHLESDRGELDDLAARRPGRVESMARAWDDWAERCYPGALGKEPAEGDGRGVTVAAPRVAGKALTISCEVEPRSRDGVVLAQGGDQQGYALHLGAGRLAFSVRVDGRVTTISSNGTPPGRFSVTARLDRDASMQLSIDDRVVARGQAPGLIPVQPQDGLSIGEDSGTAVGDYPPPHPLRGTVANVRVVPE
jgi:arylsulfatase